MLHRPLFVVSLSLVATATTSAHAACTTPPDVRVCEVGCAYSDLAAAVSAATSGDRICIEGDYTHTGGQVLVRAGRTLTIEHDGLGVAMLETSASAQLKVDGTLTLSGLVIDGAVGSERGIKIAPGGTLDATGITVRNHASPSLNLNGVGMEVDGGEVTCTDCVFDGNTTTGSQIGGHVFVRNSGVLNLEGGSYVNGSASSGGAVAVEGGSVCLLYTSPSPRDGLLSRMPSSA